MSVGQMSVGQMSVGQMSVGQMFVGQMFVGQMSVGQMSVGQMSVGQMSVGQMSVGHISGLLGTRVGTELSGPTPPGGHTAIIVPTSDRCPLDKCPLNKGPATDGRYRAVWSNSTRWTDRGLGDTKRGRGGKGEKLEGEGGVNWEK